MLRSFKYLIFIGIVTTSCSSSKKLNLWTKQSKIEEVRNFESQLNPNSEFLNQNVSLSESIYPRVKEFEMANPLIVKREKEGLLPVYVEYFYSKPDSVIRYVSYDWENNRYGNYFDRKKDWELQSKKLAEYNAEYDRIKKQLTSKFGQPMEQDSQPQEVKSEDGRPSYLLRNTIWESDERFMKLNMIFGASTYRIRLYYYWK
ncbi:MAG: hypothetical protein CMP12_11750 [Zunongwangia sp.]|uniref:Lipoprotein n=1 Tax=Zunongwangia profunda TaxID=398743 RepID=A0A3D5IY19_9FLAO|nr:hypothetical protein [Flavobacteriaceae bacterium]MAO36555.1 hypothetical protein [Zunongwangia sp.]MAQ41544.1 hypothetical protein [Mesonia sp.]MBJ96370.1 hypothetical protein [Flavobacteriaceae bacterium]HCV80741.1 hypothetical protein [Zunongwangia profunda]|tara:strand:+ start:521 stop:1126 length:606 start_codon:yes stop_codon:yes gene_type:complete